VPSDSVNAMLDLSMQHTVHLRSFYDYSFARYTSEGAESVNQLARAGLQHQLYDSLSTTIDVHGALADNTSPGAIARPAGRRHDVVRGLFQAARRMGSSFDRRQRELRPHPSDQHRLAALSSTTSRTPFRRPEIFS
jgi:hypothetical protein